MSDLDEIHKKLREMGIPFNGEWGDTKAQTNIESPIVNRQKKALAQVETLLQKQVEDDQKMVAELHVQLQRLKHGGGS
jgi:hypothetical protein